MVIVESREMYSSSSTFRPPQGHHNHHPGGPLSNNNGSHRNNGGGGKVYVGNLSTEVTDEHLFDFFVSGGIDAKRITKVVVKSGFAFVEFVDQATVDEAVAACNGKPFMNTVVRVEQSFRTSENSRYQPSKLIQVLVSNCNEEMTRDHLKMLLDESQIPIVSIEEVRMRTTMPGSRSFVARVSNMRLAQKTVEEWNNKIVSGSRLQITIMDERFSDGAGDSGPQQHQEPGSMMYTPNDDVVTDVGNFDIPLRILIPNEFVGAIIGRGGTTIKAISKGTGARLDIYRQHNRNYEMPEKPVSISGPREKASQACRKVLEIIAQEADHMRERKFDIALKLFVPNGVVGRIIGKAGSVIKEMMDVTQTKIHISNQPEYMEDSFNARRSNQRIITIRGSIDGMCQAESMISAKLREAYIEGKVRDRDLEFAYPSPSRNTSTMGYVGVSPMITNPYLLPTPPHSNYPYERRYNNQLYGVRFNSSSNYPMDPEDDGLLSRPEVAYMYVPDEIVGALIGRKGESIREIIHASGASIKILEGVVYVHDYPSRRVVIHGGAQSLFYAETLIHEKIMKDWALAIEHNHELTVEMTVPTDLVGRLIGKGGANVREIQRQNFCRIKFMTEPDMSIPPPQEGETYVRITGTAEAFGIAQKKIRALLVKVMSKTFSYSHSHNETNESRLDAPEEELPMHS